MTLEEFIEHPAVQACATLYGYGIVWNRWKEAPVFDRDGSEFQFKADVDVDAIFAAILDAPELDPFLDLLEPVASLDGDVE